MVSVEDLVKIDSNLRELAIKNMSYVEPCHFCGFCCQNRRILVTIPEIKRILTYTGETFDNVFKIEDNELSISIKTKEIDGEEYCVFYENGKCSIYPVRPFQCLSYPIIFNVFYDKLPTYWRVERGYFYFRCQRDHHRKCRMKIKSKAFADITIKRHEFLEINYKIQKKLIETGEIKTIHVIEI